MTTVFGESIGSTYDHGMTTYDLRIAATCNHCNEIMVAQFSSNQSLTYLDGFREALDKARGVVWLPTSVGRHDFPHVPERIARAAQEAHQAAEIGADMAAILMARTTVEATAKDKRVSGNNLVTKINGLQDAGHIRRGIADAAHQIRHLGNEMAHGDIDDAPEAQDAADVLALMDAVLRDVYETTAITTGIMNRRRG